MKIGILALAAIFLASGAKNLKDSGVLRKRGEKDKADRSRDVYSGRKLLFGCLMLLLGAMVLVYYAFSW